MKELKKFYRFLDDDECYVCHAHDMALVYKEMYNKTEKHPDGLIVDMGEPELIVEAVCNKCGATQGNYELVEVENDDDLVPTMYARRVR